MSSDVEIIPVGRLHPSTYNPRLADAERLDLLRLSLSKLGFLSPIYATRDGEIISGHQRHLTAQRMGLTHVPVSWCKPMDLEKRKAVNILFNRGTNDIGRTIRSSDLRAQAMAVDWSKFEMLPNVCLTDGFAPCAKPIEVELKPIGMANAHRFDDGMRNAARQLIYQKFFLPIVMCQGEVINGIGRVQHLLEKGYTHAHAVEINPDQAELASAMMNRLSMDFDIHNRYRDTLRHNSFRRARLRRQTMGSGFTFFIPRAGDRWDVTNPANADKFRQHAGDSVVDFGAGHLHETNMLRSVGIHVAAFEPFHITDNDDIDKEASLRIVRDFLADISTGRAFSTVFISNVLNSVPFESDRRHIAALTAALCGPKSFLRVSTMSVNNYAFQEVDGYECKAGSHSRISAFALEYEEGVTLGDFQRKPKVQKFHTAEELASLFDPYFRSLDVYEVDGQLFLTARNPIPDAIKPDLQAAIEFEFDLPYPDGSRMGLVDEAKAAYSQRLGFQIP